MDGKPQASIIGAEREPEQAEDHQEIRRGIGHPHELGKRRSVSLEHGRPQDKVPAKGNNCRHNHEAIQHDAQTRDHWKWACRQ